MPWRYWYLSSIFHVEKLGVHLQMLIGAPGCPSLAMTEEVSPNQGGNRSKMRERPQTAALLLAVNMAHVGHWHAIDACCAALVPPIPLRSGRGRGAMAGWLDGYREASCHTVRTASPNPFIRDQQQRPGLLSHLCLQALSSTRYLQHGLIVTERLLPRLAGQTTAANSSQCRGAQWCARDAPGIGG